jgi:hypothetical protein
MKVELEMISVKDCLPPNETHVVVQLKDEVSKKTKIVSAYFENGHWWESSYSDACGVQKGGSDYKGVKEYDWRVTHWAKQ